MFPVIRLHFLVAKLLNCVLQFSFKVFKRETESAVYTKWKRKKYFFTVKTFCTLF